jgi:hypothetical protein
LAWWSSWPGGLVGLIILVCQVGLVGLALARLVVLADVVGLVRNLTIVGLVAQVPGLWVCCTEGEVYLFRYFRAWTRYCLPVMNEFKFHFGGSGGNIQILGPNIQSFASYQLVTTIWNIASNILFPCAAQVSKHRGGKISQLTSRSVPCSASYTVYQFWLSRSQLSLMFGST